MFALADCNNFFASCERVFRPDLQGKPVIVLSNNDGCAITFVSEKEQTQFKTVEDFLEKTIYKIPVPEELGEVPEYTPKTVEKNKRKHSAKGKKGGNGRNYHRKKKAGNVEK